MGNSYSENSNPVLHISSYDRFVKYYNLHNKICKADFINIFQSFDPSFVESLSDHCLVRSLNNNEIIEPDFEALLENFCFKSSHEFIGFLIKICHITSKIQTEQIKLILRWISFSSNEEFCSIISNSFIKSQVIENDENPTFDTDSFLSWIDRHFPDIAYDFCKAVSRILNCVDNDFRYCNYKMECLDITRTLNSSIIDFSDLQILFGCLPSVYKSSENVEKFSFQNCKHWIMLYNSHINGLSSSKLKETSFDYNGPLLIILKSTNGVFCLASDMGLKEDWNVYGGIDTRFIQLKPFYQKFLSGFRSQNANGTGSGTIYSHFSAKSGRRGLFVGHNPLKSPALELNEDINMMTVLGKSGSVEAMEVWAVGCDVEKRKAKLNDIRQWEKKEVAKYKDRKLKSEDWNTNPDRELLDWGGVNVRHTDLIGGDLKERENCQE